MTFYGLNSQTMMKLLPYNNDTAPTTCKIFPFKISTKLKKTEAKTTVIKNWLHTPKSLIEIETFVENSIPTKEHNLLKWKNLQTALHFGLGSLVRHVSASNLSGKNLILDVFLLKTNSIMTLSVYGNAIHPQESQQKLNKLAGWFSNIVQAVNVPPVPTDKIGFFVLILTHDQLTKINTLKWINLNNDNNDEKPFYTAMNDVEPYTPILMELKETTRKKIFRIKDALTLIGERNNQNATQFAYCLLKYGKKQCNVEQDAFYINYFSEENNRQEEISFMNKWHILEETTYKLTCPQTAEKYSTEDILLQITSQAELKRQQKPISTLDILQNKPEYKKLFSTLLEGHTSIIKLTGDDSKQTVITNRQENDNIVDKLNELIILDSINKFNGQITYLAQKRIIMYNQLHYFINLIEQTNEVVHNIEKHVTSWMTQEIICEKHICYTVSNMKLDNQNLIINKLIEKQESKILTKVICLPIYVDKELKSFKFNHVQVLLQGQYMKHKNTFIPMKCLERQTCTELMGENQDFFTFNRIQNMYFYIFRNEAIIFHTGKDDIMDSHNNFIMPNVNIRVNRSRFPLLLNNRRINFAELNKIFESNLQRHREFNDESAWNDFYEKMQNQNIQLFVIYGLTASTFIVNLVLILRRETCCRSSCQRRSKNQNKPESESKLNRSPASRSTQTNKPLPDVKLKGKNDEEISYRIDPATFPSQIK